MTALATKAGIIGWPAKHSLSPRIHRHWLHAYGIAGEYDILETPPDGFEIVFRSLEERGYRGVNLTVPFKEKVLSLLDTVDETAQRTGAVNTVVISAGKYHGMNTDLYGFTENLKRYGKDWDALPKGKAVVLGAGGAARAVCAALMDEGFARIVVANRSAERRESLAKHLGIEAAKWEAREELLDDANLLVNTTTLGMRGQLPLEIKLDRLPRAAWVNDIVYAPRLTPLLAQAQMRGHVTVGGIGMLLCQAQPAFAAWFGVTPDITLELEHSVEAA